MDHEKCLLMLHHNKLVFLALMISIWPFAAIASGLKSFDSKS